MFDGIITVDVLKFFIQNINFGPHFLQCGIVQEHQGFPAIYVLVVGNMKGAAHLFTSSFVIHDSFPIPYQVCFTAGRNISHFYQVYHKSDILSHF